MKALNRPKLSCFESRNELGKRAFASVGIDGNQPTILCCFLLAITLDHQLWAVWLSVSNATVTAFAAALKNEEQRLRDLCCEGGGMNFSDCCEHTPMWVESEATSLLHQLGVNSSGDEREPDMEELHAKIYMAFRKGDLSSALDTCNQIENWQSLVLGAIDHLSHDWKATKLSVVDVAEAYCIARRCFEEMELVSQPRQLVEFSLGRVAILFPPGEKHSFGALLLSDQLKRLGWAVELLNDRSDAANIEKIGSNHFDAIGISVGTDKALTGIADLISHLRQKSFNPSVRLSVGGSAINGSISNFDFLAADFVATSAEDTITFFQSGPFVPRKS